MYTGSTHCSNKYTRHCSVELHHTGLPCRKTSGEQQGGMFPGCDMSTSLTAVPDVRSALLTYGSTQ